MIIREIHCKLLKNLSFSPKMKILEGKEKR
jgi:hypothetical protein